MKEIITYFEYALKHNEDDKMKMISGMYNYHVENAKDDYPVIYPVLIFYPSGNKEKGLKMLKECTKSADRNISVRSMFYLARIYRNDEKDYSQSKFYFEKLLTLYPENLVWRHEYISTLKRFNKLSEAETHQKILDEKIQVSKQINDEQKIFLQSEYKY
jgi:tetratricopeptide (TPR) repeat protein